MQISKSKFVAGIQCLKRLYLQVHHPELAAEMNEASAVIIEQGRQVGTIAQRAFPGGVMVDVKPAGLDEAISATRTLMADSSVPAIFEATLRHNDVLIRADILKRSSQHRYQLIEVKSSVAMKPHYAYDIGIQRHVLAGAGLEIEKASLMHLNRAYAFEGREYDVSRLFVIVEPTPEQTVSEAEISDRLKEQFRILNEPMPPGVKPGPQCEDPYICEFFEHCNPALPPHHVSLLPGIRAEKIQELLAAGIHSIKDIPPEFPVSERQQRVLSCVQSGIPFVSPELAVELGALKYPLCFMDFETVFPALPRFSGMSPYDHIPFQWSVHRIERPGDRMEHYEYLAEDGSDPRVPFTDSLCRAVEGAVTIVVYNQGFESGRLDDLARWLPERRSDLETIQAKLWDLLVAVRKHVYHPAFAGSFSLKSVLPAFVPEMSFRDLEIAEGIAAGAAWMRLLHPGIAANEKGQLRKALLAYCNQDTLGLARLTEELQRIALKA